MSNDSADPSRRKQRLFNLTNQPSSPKPQQETHLADELLHRKPSCYILLSVGEIESYNQLFSSRVAAPRIESIKRTLSTPPPPHTVEHILHPARFQLSNPTPHHRRRRLRVGRFLVTRTTCRRILEEVLVPANGPQFTIDSNLTRSRKLLVWDQVN
jgi:hypothetical protein